MPSNAPQPEPPAPSPSATTCAACGKPKDEHIEILDELYCYEFTRYTSREDAVAKFVPPASAPAATAGTEMTWQCANCHAVLPVSPIIAERGGPMRCTACDGKGTKHYDRRPAAPTGEEAGQGFHFTEPRRCVECEACGFAFDATHRNDNADGEYSCPNCAESARAADQAIATAARAFFDRWVATQPPGRAFPWMPNDLLTALVEDYDRRHPTTGAAPA